MWALEWAWHPAETNMRYARSLRIYMPIISRLYKFGDHTVHMDGDPDQEYIYFIGSKTLSSLPSTCYILSEESSIPLYSRSNAYNK